MNNLQRLSATFSQPFFCDLSEMVLTFLLFISLLSVACSGLTWDDKRWLGEREIMTDLAEVVFSNMALME